MSGEGVGAAVTPVDHAVLVILPTFHEVDSLAEVVARIFAVTPQTDVLIIDDASSDGTGALADRLSAEDPRISVIHRSAKFGLGTAYVAGFKHAITHGYHRVVEMDADGSHAPEELPALLAASTAGAGIVIGTRWIPGGRIEGWPFYRRCISRTGTQVARISLRSELHDATSGFRVIDTAWLARVDLSRIAAQGYGFQVEMAWTLERHGCPVAEVPITFVERRAGRSKMSPRIVSEALRLVLRWGWQLRTAPDRLPRLMHKPEITSRAGYASESEITP